MTEPWFPERPVEAGVAPERPRYRPPVGVPAPKHARWQSTLLSITLHALILVLILAPFVANQLQLEEVDGAGGDGPAGGGGGGRRGNGLGVTERLHYVPVAPAPAPTVTPPVAPPVVPPVVPPPVPPKQDVPPPVVPPPVQPAAEPTPVVQAVSAPPAPVEGAGTGGTGSDGTAGSGPGSGGGVGAGVGTGRGGGTGPGTGGGNADVYPPQPTELFIPPLPAPSRVRGTEMVAVFEVDSTGKVLKFDFTPTRDGGYNKKLREILAGMRFKPATRLDGRPVRANASVTYSF